MSLTVVATPIGNLKDITLRAIEALREASVIVGEERKPLFKLFRELGLPTPSHFELLNEHSQATDIERLADLCSKHNVALVSDCGTPGFSDPGAELVHLCRRKQITVHSTPGPSSLTYFLSLCGVRITEFHFAGFLPRDTEDRTKAILSLGTFNIPVIIMDTPYRLNKTLSELKELRPEQHLILGMDFTKPSERFITGRAEEIIKKHNQEKREFMLMLLPLTKKSKKNKRFQK